MIHLNLTFNTLVRANTFSANLIIGVGFSGWLHEAALPNIFVDAEAIEVNILNRYSEPVLK